MAAERDADAVGFATPYDAIAHGAAAARPAGEGGAAAAIHIGATIAIPAGLSAQAFVDEARRAAPEAGGATVLIPPLWAPALAGADRRVLLPAIIRAANPPPGAGVASAMAEAVADVSRKAFGPRAGEIALRLNAPVPAGVVNAAAQGWSGVDIPPGAPDVAGAPIVVMATIDDATPFAHMDLRDRNGRSRVECCHLQPVFPAAGGPAAFGMEFSRADIDALVAAHGPDEDAIYAESGALAFARPNPSALTRLATHGAHVLGAAAGFRHGRRWRAYESEETDLDQLRVIAVQLPVQPEMDAALYGRDGAILAGAHYIFHQAEKIAAAYGQTSVPLIMTLSYGFTAGPHNGRSDIEAELAALLAIRRAAPISAPTHIVLPAGNTFASSLIASIKADDFVAAGDVRQVDIPWRISPTDRTRNILEVWFEAGADLSSLAIDLIAPGGGGLTLAAGEAAGDFAGRSVIAGAGTAGECACGMSAGLRRLSIVLHPTEPTPGATGLSPPGRWTLRLSCPNPAALAGPVRCRIQRDEDRAGRVRGARQSYFDDPRDVPHAPDGTFSTQDRGLVARYGSINGLATNGAFIVAAGYEERRREPARYSAAGEIASGPGSMRAGHVSCSAPTDTSSVLRGRIGSGSRSGAYFRLVGTSSAAPRVARALARAYLGKPSGWSGPDFDGAPIAALDAEPTAPAANPDAEPARRERLGALMFR